MPSDEIKNSVQRKPPAEAADLYKQGLAAGRSPLIKMYDNDKSQYWLGYYDHESSSWMVYKGIDGVPDQAVPIAESKIVEWEYVYANA